MLLLITYCKKENVQFCLTAHNPNVMSINNGGQEEWNYFLQYYYTMHHFFKYDLKKSYFFQAANWRWVLVFIEVFNFLLKFLLKFIEVLPAVSILLF